MNKCFTRNTTYTKKIDNIFAIVELTNLYWFPSEPITNIMFSLPMTNNLLHQQVSNFSQQSPNSPTLGHAKLRDCYNFKK